MTIRGENCSYPQSGGVGLLSYIDSKNKENSFSTKTKAIGISLAKSYVNTHRGKIEVTSDIEKGSTFIIKLPIQRREDKLHG